MAKRSADSSPEGGYDDDGKRVRAGQVSDSSVEEHENFVIQKVDERTSKIFKTGIYDYRVRFKNLENFGIDEVNDKLYDILSQVFTVITKDTAKNDYCRVVLRCPSLDYPISIPYVKMDNFSLRLVLDRIESVLNSNETLLLDRGLQVNFIHTKFPEPGLGKKKIYNNFETFQKSKRSIVTIPTSSNCLGFALLLGTYAVNNPSVRRLTGYSKILKSATGCNLINELYEKSGVEIDTPCGIEELCKFQRTLATHNIIVYDGCKNVQFNGGINAPHVFLLLHEAHFNLIRSITGFFSSKFFCHACLHPYFTTHKCQKGCTFCKNNMCPNTDIVTTETTCIYCNFTWLTKDCFTTHITSNYCRDMLKCTECYRTIARSKKDSHHCGQHYCTTCKDWYNTTDDHLCYMKSVKLKDSSEYCYIYFDIESMTDPFTGRHIANLLVAKQEECKPLVFKGPSCVGEFMTFLLAKSNKLKKTNFVVVAHFLSGYDSYFILKWLYTENIVPKNVIIKGTKFMILEVKSNLKFLDSYNFLLCPLRSLPKAFNFSTKLCKGWFPHTFNTPKNQDYVGPFPNIEYFEPQQMSPGNRATFMQWYESEAQSYKNKQFNLQEALEAYCIDDVEVLEIACQKFRKMFLETSGLDIFANCCTIASAVSIVFRCNYLTLDTIAVIGSNNPDKVRKNSKLCEQWIRYTAASNDINIQSALHGGEKKIGKYYVDGYCSSNNTIYEFLGCYIHGCDVCYSQELYNSFLHKTMGTLKKQTTKRLQILAKVGYNIVTIWSHEWEELKRSSTEVQKFLKDNDLDRDILNVRSCLRGGRVSTMRAMYKIKPGEKIFYKDVNSLYPYVLKNKPMPIKFPEIITENFKPLNEYFGLIYCKVLPPDTLVLGVLPYSDCKGKLVFPLCATCSEEGLNKPCTHSSNDRSLKGVWTHFELLYAVNRGYVVQEMYEVWHFEEQSSSIFEGYINNYLKLKTEASGFPNSCSDDASKDEFIKLWKEREGICLDKSKMIKNPGIRAIAKLALNSLWGKFGQNMNFSKSCYVNNYEDLIKFLIDCRYDVTDVEMAGNNMMLLNYKLKQETEIPAAFSNLPIACFTTSHARLHLLSLMEKVEDQVLYSDTDSIFYVSKTNGSELPESIFLGDLKNELDGDFSSSAYISEFYCTGAKSYCYVVTDQGSESIVFKIKGFTLTAENMTLLNIDNFKKLIGNQNEETYLNNFEIKRDKATAELYSRSSTKKLKFTLHKRLLCRDMTTRCIGDKRVDSQELFDFLE